MYTIHSVIYIDISVTKVLSFLSSHPKGSVVESAQNLTPEKSGSGRRSVSPARSGHDRCADHAPSCLALAFQSQRSRGCAPSTVRPTPS